MRSVKRKIALAVVLTTAFWLAVIFLLYSVILAGEPGLASPGLPALPQASEGTRRMVQRLQEFIEQADPETNPFLIEERIRRLKQLDPPRGGKARFEYDLRLAVDLLNAGQTLEAVERFKVLWERSKAAPALRSSALGQEIHSLLAVAHLRLGEQDNCIKQHDTDSCLLPIRGGGVHARQEGSRAAIRELSEILDSHPDDLGSRWLLNLAYMTVGEYPEQVPEPWLVPPSAFDSDHDIGRFRDVAAEVGLDVVGWAGGAMMEDFDGDGYLDMMLTSWGLRDQVRLFLNDRDGTFRETTAEAGLDGIVSGLNAVHADYDNDGDMDVFVPRGAWLREAGLMPPSLLRNDGGGAFDDVTEEAGLLAYYPSQVAAWGDYDNDGWVDLFVATESTKEGQRPALLYHNDGDGTFTEVAKEVGVAALGYLKGAVWGDYDNDGLADLFVTAMESEPHNKLFHNEGSDGHGGWRFKDVAEQAGVLGPRSAFPAWFFDYDNDGWLDIFVSSYAGTVADIAAEYLGLPHQGEASRLYRNQGDGTFRDVSREAGVDKVLIAMGCNFGDLDNDGWLDFYVGTGNPDFRTLVPNRMFRNDGGRRFQDVTTSGGFGHLQKGHGIAFGDVDHDGDQDVFLKVGGAYAGDSFQSALFENPGHGNHWITLKLVGVETNRAAIGARIRVTIDEAGTSREIHASVSSGSSFGGSPLRQQIGLGRAERIRSIEITWPASGRRQLIEDVEMDQILEVHEGVPTPRRIELARLKLG